MEDLATDLAMMLVMGAKFARIVVLVSVAAYLIYVFSIAPHHLSDGELVELIRQRHTDMMSDACRELADADDVLSNRTLTKPYDSDIWWTLKWKPTRPELQRLASLLCGLHSETLWRRP